MWCSSCQQDVALDKSPGSSASRCGKCGQALRTDEITETPPIQSIAEKPAATTPPNLAALDDDWTIEAELRGLERLVGSLKAVGLTPDEPVALHSSHAALSGWHAVAGEGANTQTKFASTATSAEELGRPKSHLAAWTILSIGLATFACGGVLLGWSVLGQREDLWPIGMPLALLGQAGLVFGLILQLDSLWQTSRKTAETLNELDGELKNVRQATTLLTTTRSSAGQSFYAHMAQGAAPQLLLADLKGQLDLLAQQMAERR